METRGRAKAQAAQSSSTPVNPLEGSGPRPPSRVSEVEGDLGLTSLLGGGKVLNVGESHTQESAMSGISDVTVVAAQVPITESGLVTSYGQTEADSVHPLLAATRTTTLPGPCAQAPIGSTQVPTLTHRLTNRLTNRYSTLLRRNTHITFRHALHGVATIYLRPTRGGLTTAFVATATGSVRTIVG